MAIGMVTRQDVATRAGVSTATVSYVLNETPGVKIMPETAETVRRVAREIGYQPNRAARNLATGRFGQVGILASFNHSQSLFSPYHEGVFRGIWQTATDAGLRVVIDLARPGGPISYLQERSVDGFITLAPTRAVFTECVRRALRDTKMPSVSVGGGGWLTEVRTVDVDNTRIGREAAALLAGRGHRSVAVLGGDSENDTTRQRAQGFWSVMAGAGVSAPRQMVVETGYSAGESLDVARALLREQRPTAVFCINDHVALDVVRAALEVGLDIPGDLSVIGVDGIPAGQQLETPLTTFRQPLLDMGQAAFDILMSGKGKPAGRIFEAQLVEGGTVGPCPTGRQASGSAGARLLSLAESGRGQAACARQPNMSFERHGPKRTERKGKQR